MANKSWFSLVKDVPGALIESTQSEPYHFEPDDETSNVIEIPQSLDRMHKLASQLIRESVHHLAEADRATRAAERAQQDLERVQQAIDEKLQDIGLRAVNKMESSND